MYWNCIFIPFVFSLYLEIYIKGNNVSWGLLILGFHEYSVVTLSVVWDDGAAWGGCVAKVSEKRVTSTLK